jgi:hypothetical protein
LTADRASEASPLRLCSNLNLAPSSASNFMIRDRSVESVDPLASLRYRSIFSRVTNLFMAASQWHRKRCAFLAAEATPMSDTGHNLRCVIAPFLLFLQMIMGEFPEREG